MSSNSECRNLHIHGRRTSVRLEADMWWALEEAGKREGTGLEQICERLEGNRDGGSLSAALRVYALKYRRRRAAQ